MAAAEQLKELGEKLQAAAPAPADELAKLLEVRRLGPSGSCRAREWPPAPPSLGGGWRRVGFGWICARGAGIRQV
jgi:hypothetical protein